jgi:hypothetical protein
MAHPTFSASASFAALQQRHFKFTRFPLFLLILWGTMTAGIVLNPPSTALAASQAASAASSKIEEPAYPSGLISRNVPAYSSSDQASAANSADYGTYLREQVPGWLAYDLSSVPRR